jgi:hypothetical protein
MYDRDLPSPCIPKSHRDNRIPHLSILPCSSSRNPYALCLRLPKVQRGKNVGPQPSVECDYLLSEHPCGSTVEDVRRDPNGQDRTVAQPNRPRYRTIEQIGRRQPDWLLISDEFKRIAIPDLCRPSNVLPPQLQAAAQRKQQAYSPLEEALSYYTKQGWIVHQRHDQSNAC